MVNQTQTWTVIGVVLTLAALGTAMVPVLIRRQFRTVHVHLDSLERIVDRLEQTRRRLPGAGDR